MPGYSGVILDDEARETEGSVRQNAPKYLFTVDEHRTCRFIGRHCICSSVVYIAVH